MVARGFAIETPLNLFCSCDQGLHELRAKGIGPKARLRAIVLPDTLTRPSPASGRGSSRRGFCQHLITFPRPILYGGEGRVRGPANEAGGRNSFLASARFMADATESG